MEVGKEKRGKERKGRPGKLMFPGHKSRETFFSAFPFGANLFFDTRGRHWLVSSLGQRSLWCPFSTEWGTFPSCFPSLLLWAATSQTRFWRNVESVWVQKDWVRLPLLLPCCSPLTLLLGQWIYMVFSALQIARSLIFLTADTTPGVFKNHIQWCPGKCETTSSPKKGGGGVWFVALANSPGVNTPTMAGWQDPSISWEETHSSRALQGIS